MKAGTLKLHTIVLSLIGFILLWTVVTDAWGSSAYIFGNDGIGGKTIYAVISRIVWVLPAVFCIGFYKNQLATTPKSFIKNRPRCKMFYIVLGISVLYGIIYMLALHGGFGVYAADPIWSILIKLLVVAVVEETVFRGWGYNALVSVVSMRKARILSTFLFIVLHWPAYFIKLYLTGSFDWAGIIGQSAAALIWGILCCHLFQKDKSIWSAVIPHFFYDFMLYVFVG